MALRERARAISPHVAPEIAAYADVVPFATPPVDVTCHHGCHSYVARQVARRDRYILFIDPRTEQFGIAVLMFLGAPEAMDE